MNENQQRQEGIDRYLKGEKIAQIVRSLGKSRKWLHHWINRYKSNVTNENWFLDESKDTKQTNPSIDAEMEQHVLLIRNDLVKEKMEQIGAISIQYECEKRGIHPVPPV